MFTNRAYINSPIFIQNITISLRSVVRKVLREGSQQSKLLNEIKANDYDLSASEKFNHERLQRILTSASDNVSFYKYVNSSSSVNLSDFPFITKDDIRQDPELFDNLAVKGMVIKGATSGTTGTPLVIKQNLESVIREQAFVARHLEWAGLQPGDKRAWIRGDMIVPFEQKKGPFWRYSWFENMIMLSSFHMSPNHLQGYINAMVDYGVQVIQAYPSSIVTLAKFLEVNDRYYPSDLKSIVTSSESLSQDDKLLVEKRFKCTVFDWYGLFERVAAIGSCEHGRYHILTDYAHVELLPAGETDDGKKRAEIVGTNFNNELYPLIRYRTGDHVYLTEEQQCPCGRIFPIIDRIEGRIGDYLLGEDGQKIHILNHIPKGVNGLIATQFIQNKANTIEVQVVVDIVLFDAEQKQILIDNTKARLGQKMEVFVKIVDTIQKTKNGKTRQAICTVKEPLLEK